ALGDLVRTGLADEVALQLVQIEPRAKRALAAADHDHPHLRVVLGADTRVVELLEQLLADGIALVRSVQPDARDVSVDFVLDRLDLDDTWHDRLPRRV